MSWQAGQAISLAQAQAGAGTGSADRTLTTSYDRLGRRTAVAQVAVTYYKANGSTASGSPTTQFTYDAYGDLVKQSVLIEGTAGQSDAKWAETYRHYDDLGRNVLTVDPEGYATATAYDARGQATSTTEYARALDTESLTVDSRPGAPAAGGASIGFDRVTKWEYDALGRKVTETVIRHYQRVDGSSGVRDLVTQIGYDAEDHALTISVDGAVTTSTYDALGRTMSVREPMQELVFAGRYSTA